jgi:ribosomal protein L10
MKKQEKEVIINNVLNTVSKSTGLFVIDFKKINSFKIVSLKKQLFKSNGSMVVVKNSLLFLAAKQNSNLEKISSSFQQQIALIYSFGDVFEVAGIVNEFLKDSQVGFKVGLINDSKLNIGVFEKISKISSQKNLYARVCGVLRNPIVNLISTLIEISKK